MIAKLLTSTLLFLTLFFIRSTTDQSSINLNNPSFWCEEPIVTGSTIYEDVLSADFNNDGHLDLIAAGNVHMLLLTNTGTGQFLYDTLNDINNSYCCLEITDIDNDGDQDILAGVRSENSIVMFENESNGSFTINTINSNKQGVNSIEVRDYDFDNDLDILSTSQFNDRIEILLNQNDGSFNNLLISQNTDSPSDAFFLDVDSDGDLDVIAAGTEDNKIVQLINQDNFIFTEEEISEEPEGLSRIELGDLNNDGNIDLLALNPTQQSLKIFYQENDGSFSTPVFIDNDAGSIQDIHIDDINGDGFLDIFSIENISGKINWYKNTNLGFTKSTIVHTANGAQCIKLIDIDQDTDLDIISSCIENGRISKLINGDEDCVLEIACQDVEAELNAIGNIYINGSDADGGSVGPYDFINQTLSATTFDCNQLGQEIPLVYSIIDETGNAQQCNLNVSLSVGNSFYYPMIEHIVFSSANGATSVTKADFNEDGLLDIVCTSWFDYSIRLLINEGNMIFSEIILYNSINKALDATVIDLDFDGDMDITVCSQTDNQILYFINEGGLSFSPNVISPNLEYLNDISPVDIDQDGDIDFICSSAADNKVSWLENDGNFQFTQITVSDNLNYPKKVFTIDLDQDGDIDILSASFYDHKIAYFKNDGANNFSEEVISTNAINAQSVIAADLNNDNLIDIISASASDNKIAYYRNNGNISFDEVLVSTDSKEASSIEAVDIDLDGDIDILGTSAGNNRVAWFRNNGSGQFETMSICNDAENAQGATAADMDNDGDLDIISASAADDLIRVFETGESNCQVTALCAVQDTVYLDQDGSASLSVSQIDDESTSPFQIDDYSLNLTSADCSMLDSILFVQLNVTDNLGESDSCNTQLIVLDTIAPMINPLDTLSLLLYQGGILEWNVDSIASQVNDNCDFINLSILNQGNDTSIFLDDSNIGLNTILISAMDASGNETIIPFYIQLNYYEPVPSSIKTASNVPVNKVDILVNTEFYDESNDEGIYLIPLLSSLPYTIKPYYNEQVTNGLSTFDLVFIIKHILGTETFNSPYQYIAADANNSESITTIDIVQLQKIILQIDTEFPNNTSWRFVPNDYIFTNDPFDFPEEIQINDIDNIYGEFIGIKIGDMNLSFEEN